MRPERHQGGEGNNIVGTHDAKQDQGGSWAMANDCEV
jgi:hypothetical protein